MPPNRGDSATRRAEQLLTGASSCSGGTEPRACPLPWTCLQGRVGFRHHISHPIDTMTTQTLLRLRPHPRHLLDIERRHERFFRPCRHDDKPARFAQLAGDLGHQAIGGYAHRYRNLEFLPNTPLQPAHHSFDLFGGFQPARPQIQVSLINRISLHLRRDVLAKIKHLPRDAAVIAFMRQQDQIRTNLDRPLGWHRRVDSGCPCFVTGRGNDAPLATAHRHFFTPKLRSLGQLYRNIKGIGIEVDNRSKGHPATQTNRPSRFKRATAESARSTRGRAGVFAPVPSKAWPAPLLKPPPIRCHRRRQYRPPGHPIHPNRAAYR